MCESSPSKEHIDYSEGFYRRHSDRYSEVAFGGAWDGIQAMAPIHRRTCYASCWALPASTSRNPCRALRRHRAA